MKIQIDKEPFEIVSLYNGSYTCDMGDAEEYREEIYDFTLKCSKDIEVFNVVIWQSPVPEDFNYVKAEAAIIEFFNKQKT